MGNNNYMIYKNGKVIKTGFKEVRNDRDEEVFELQMKQKYMTSDMDVVEVCWI